VTDAGTATQASPDEVVSGLPTPPAQAERPELAVAAAFAGGLLAALVLRRIAGGD
jgi:hypothetical protein